MTGAKTHYVTLHVTCRLPKLSWDPKLKAEMLNYLESCIPTETKFGKDDPHLDQRPQKHR